MGNNKALKEIKHSASKRYYPYPHSNIIKDIGLGLLSKSRLGNLSG